MSRGFTLIEILVVVVILALVALGIMALLPSGYKQVTDAGRMSVVNHLGYEKLDELKALGYAHSDLTAGTHPSIVNYRLDSVDPDLKGYSLKWEVDNAQPKPDIKTVNVEVGYMLYNVDGSDNSGNKFQLKQNFVTYIAR